MKKDGIYQNMIVDIKGFINESSIKDLSYMDYLDSDDLLIITKGTLENIIEAFPLDLKEIAGFDNTKIQTLKQSGGTLMWITDEENVEPVDNEE